MPPLQPVEPSIPSRSSITKRRGLGLRPCTSGDNNTRGKDFRGNRREWRSDTSCAPSRSRRNCNTRSSDPRGRNSRARADSDRIRQHRSRNEWCYDDDDLLTCVLASPKCFSSKLDDGLISPSNTHTHHYDEPSSADATGHGDLCSPGARLRASLQTRVLADSIL
jgi:hypothetical protein